MIDRSKLEQKTQASQADQTAVAAKKHFARALDGLASGSKRTELLKLTEGDGNYTTIGGNRVQLNGISAAVWKLLEPLAPALYAYSEWVGGREDGHNESGFILAFDWPSDEKQTELEAKRADAHIAEICDVIASAKTAIEARVKQVLAEAQSKCETAAGASKNWASVMMLKPRLDFAYPAGHPKYGDPKLQTEWLGAAAAKVFAALADDKPQLVARGTGIETYYDIVVRW